MVIKKKPSHETMVGWKIRQSKEPFIEKIEAKAKGYILYGLESKRYEFFREPDGTSLELWMKDKSLRESSKVVLKPTARSWREPSDVFRGLSLAELEFGEFKQGKIRIARVFMGNRPPKVFILDKGIITKKSFFEGELQVRIGGRISHKGIEEIR